MVGRWKQAAVWSRQSVLGPSTGIYDGVTGQPISNYGSVSATNGAILAIVAATSSRFAQVQLRRHSDNTYYLAVANFFDDNFSLMGLYRVVYAPLARMAPTAGQGITAPNYFFWTGITQSFSSGGIVQLPPGLYTIFFIAQKHFANATDSLDTIQTTFYLTA
jgi:hypothetical protein